MPKTNTNTTLDILGMLTGMLRGIVATLVAAELESLGLTPETLRALATTVHQEGAIDYRLLAANMDVEAVAAAINMTSLACEIACEISHEDIAASIAGDISHEDIAASIAEHDSAMASVARSLIRALKAT